MCVVSHFRPLFSKWLCKFTETLPFFKVLVFALKTVYFCLMNRFKQFVEWHVFGVCTAIGEKMGIATSVIRKYFIYISFITMGSPVIIYLFVAFWMNVKRYIFSARRNPLRYL